MGTAIDTLKIYERLKNAELNDKAAKEIAEVIKDTIEERLVTKEYLDIRLAELRSDIIKWVAVLLIAQAAIVATLVKLL
jgi:hypothetical protein